MTRFDIGPYFVKLNYVSNSHTHVMQFSVKPVGTPTPGNLGEVQTKGGTGVSLDAGIATLVSALKAVYPASAAFSSWDCFYKASVTAEPIWMDSGAIVGGTGTAAGGATPALQAVTTFRSALGHRLRLQIMEPNMSPDVVVPGATLSADAKWGPIVTALTGDNAIICARDGAWLVSVIRQVTKINDKLRRRYLV